MTKNMRALFTRCLIISGIIWMLPAVFMAQNTIVPKEKRLRMHQEIPDNQYLPGQSGKKSASPVYKNSGFTMVLHRPFSAARRRSRSHHRDSGRTMKRRIRSPASCGPPSRSSRIELLKSIPDRH